MCGMVAVTAVSDGNKAGNGGGRERGNVCRFWMVAGVGALVRRGARPAGG